MQLSLPLSRMADCRDGCEIHEAGRWGFALMSFDPPVALPTLHGRAQRGDRAIISWMYRILLEGSDVCQ